MSLFGTGRVTSQMRMHALLRPRASSAKGGVPLVLLSEFGASHPGLATVIRPEPLTGREQEVLQLLVQGVTTTQELSAQLVVSDNTVKFHLRNILDKLHLHNRAELVAHASRRQRLGLVDRLDFANFEPRRP